MSHNRSALIGALLLALGALLLPQRTTAQVVPGFNGYYQLICATSGKALDNRGSFQDGTAVGQWDAQQGNTNQWWQIIPLGNGYSKLICATSGKALDNGAYLSNGTAVGQWDAQQGNTNQEWHISAAGNGYSQLICATSGKALDNGAYLSNGTNVGQWDAQTGNTNQEWRLEPVLSNIEFDVYTGGDDVRAGSTVQATLAINGGAFQTYTLDPGINWQNDTTHLVSFRLRTPVTLESIQGVTINFLQQPGTSGFNADNWDLQGLSVFLYSGPAYANLLSKGYFGPGDYGDSGALFRFTQSNPTAVF